MGGISVGQHTLKLRDKGSKEFRQLCRSAKLNQLLEDSGANQISRYSILVAFNLERKGGREIVRDVFFVSVKIKSPTHLDSTSVRSSNGC